MDHLDNIIRMEPLAEKWRAFGWAVVEVDGHDMNAMQELLSSLPLQKNKPALIVAHTIKGKGISFMEDVPIWHYRPMKPDELKRAAVELGLTVVNGVVK